MRYFLAIALIVVSTPAHAAFCGKYEDFRKALELKYQEMSVAKGIASGMIIELFGSKKGSFTILAVTPDGITCIIASGDDWTNSEKESPGQKS